MSTMSVDVGATYISCTITVDNPHYSTGAAGVITKIRYTCSGTAAGTLQVNGNLYKYAPGTYGPYTPKASNNQSRAVGPGASGTVYVPADSLPGINCNMSHWFYGTAFSTLSAGPSSGSGSTSSSTVHPSRCS